MLQQAKALLIYSLGEKLNPEIHSEVHSKDVVLSKRDKKQKSRMKAYADNQKSASSPEIKPGDAVFTKQSKTTKLTPDYRPHPHTVVHIKVSLITAQRGNHWITRTISLYKKVPTELVPDDNMQS